MVILRSWQVKRGLTREVHVAVHGVRGPRKESASLHHEFMTVATTNRRRHMSKTPDLYFDFELALHGGGHICLGWVGLVGFK
jgi:hypothetical protein